MSLIFLLFALEKPVPATQTMRFTCITNIVTLKQLLEPLVLLPLLVNKHLDLLKLFLQDMKPPKSLYIEVCFKKNCVSIYCRYNIMATNSHHTHIIDFFTFVIWVQSFVIT